MMASPEELEKSAFSYYSAVDLGLVGLFKVIDPAIRKDELDSSDKNFCRLLAQVVERTMISVGASSGGMTHNQAVFFRNFVVREESDFLRYVAEVQQKRTVPYDELETLGKEGLMMVAAIHQKHFKEVEDFFFALANDASNKLGNQSPIPGIIGSLLCFFDAYFDLGKGEDEQKAADIVYKNLLYPLGAIRQGK